jgi:hypothetical protein
MRKFLMGLTGLAMAASPMVAASTAYAAPKKGDVKVSGQGTIEDGRTFTVNATLYQDGTAKGQAVLINRNFSGDTGKGPYKLQIDITCAKQLDDGTVTIGGYTRRTNDSNLVDAVFFTVEDNGKDDLLSRAYFWDDDPTTMGDPAACQLVNNGDFPMEQVIRGNINVH